MAKVIAVVVLSYVSPVTILITYFVSRKLVKKKGWKSVIFDTRLGVHSSTARLSFLIASLILSYAIEGALVLAVIIETGPIVPYQHHLPYTLLNVFVWTFISRWESALWYHVFAPMATALTFHTTITALTIGHKLQTALGNGEMAAQIFQTVLILSVLAISAHDRAQHHWGREQEVQRLLAYEPGQTYGTPWAGHEYERGYFKNFTKKVNELEINTERITSQLSSAMNRGSPDPHNKKSRPSHRDKDWTMVSLRDNRPFGFKANSGIPTIPSAVNHIPTGQSSEVSSNGTSLPTSTSPGISTPTTNVTEPSSSASVTKNVSPKHRAISARDKIRALRATLWDQPTPQMEEQDPNIPILLESTLNVFEPMPFALDLDDDLYVGGSADINGKYPYRWGYPPKQLENGQKETKHTPLRRPIKAKYPPWLRRPAFRAFLDREAQRRTKRHLDDADIFDRWLYGPHPSKWQKELDGAHAFNGAEYIVDLDAYDYWDSPLKKPRRAPRAGDPPQRKPYNVRFMWRLYWWAREMRESRRRGMKEGGRLSRRVKRITWTDFPGADGDGEEMGVDGGGEMGLLAGVSEGDVDPRAAETSLVLWKGERVS